MWGLGLPETQLPLYKLRCSSYLERGSEERAPSTVAGRQPASVSHSCHVLMTVMSPWVSSLSEISGVVCPFSFTDDNAMAMAL